MTNGCAFGRETRQMVEDMKEDIRDIKKTLEELRNHYSKRIPPIIALIISLLTGALGVTSTIIARYIMLS